MTQSGDAGGMYGGERPADWRLAEGIDLWMVWAAEPGPLWDRCLATLSEQERARAMRMRAGTAQDEFVTGRAAVRELLGAALGMQPRALAIATGKQGKPMVEGATFNVAHARGLIGIALCAQGQLGLDLEHVEAGKGWQEIADAYFTRAERNAIAGSEIPERRFCEIWSHKEAAVKAIGVGLGLEAGLADVDVTEVSATGHGEVVVSGATICLQAVQLQPAGVSDEWCCSVGCVGAPRAVRVRVLQHATLAGLLG